MKALNSINLSLFSHIVSKFISDLPGPDAMENSTLIIHVYRGAQNWSKFHTAKGTVETSIPFIADVASHMDSPQLRVLVLVPHCIARARELRDLNGLAERVRGEIRHILRMSRLNGDPLDNLYRDKHGRSLLADIRVIPLECAGRRVMDGEIIEFQGNLLWMALRTLLFINEELREMPAGRSLLVDLSGGGLYHAPIYAASDLISASYRDVSVRYVYWRDSFSAVKPRIDERGVVWGAEELLTVVSLLSAILKGCPGRLVHTLPDLVDRLRKTELGEKAAEGLLSMVGMACGLKLPVLPLAHLSILDLNRIEVPKIRDPLDLEMEVELLWYDVRTVRYSYRSFNVELDDPLTAMVIAAMTFMRERIREMGIVPSLEEFEVMDRYTGRRLRLIDMSWRWVELMGDHLLENRDLSQLTTLCSNLGPLLDVCRDVIGFGNSTGMKYDELWRLSREEGVSLLPDLLERAGMDGDLLESMKGSLEDPSNILRMRERIISHAGLSPPLVYIIHALEEGIEFLYVEDLVRKLKEPSSLVHLCSTR